MAKWVCNNCGYKFEGGIFNTRNCPKCSNPLSDFFKIIFSLGKLTLFIVPTLLLIKLVYNSLFESIVTTAKNAVSLDTAVYYNPSLYFHNLVFVKSDAYYKLKKRKLIYRRMVSFDVIKQVAPYMELPQDQVILLKGNMRKGDKSWISAEFFKKDIRQRIFILMPQDWESELSRVDISGLLNQAKEDYRKAVLAQVEYKEVAGKEAIKKFVEENPEYFRLDIEYVSIFKPLVKLFSPQYDVAYFVKNSYREKVDSLRKQYLDIDSIERKLLQYRGELL